MNKIKEFLTEIVKGNSIIILVSGGIIFCTIRYSLLFSVIYTKNLGTILLSILALLFAGFIMGALCYTFVMGFFQAKGERYIILIFAVLFLILSVFFFHDRISRDNIAIKEYIKIINETKMHLNDDTKIDIEQRLSEIETDRFPEPDYEDKYY